MRATTQPTIGARCRHSHASNKKTSASRMRNGWSRRRIVGGRPRREPPPSRRTMIEVWPILAFRAGYVTVLSLFNFGVFRELSAKKDGGHDGDANGNELPHFEQRPKQRPFVVIIDPPAAKAD